MTGAVMVTPRSPVIVVSDALAPVIVCFASYVPARTRMWSPARAASHAASKVGHAAASSYTAGLAWRVHEPPLVSTQTLALPAGGGASSPLVRTYAPAPTATATIAAPIASRKGIGPS